MRHDGNPAEEPVALQLYTVRDETANDFAGTVRRVAEMGYAGVELAGYGGLSAQEMKSLLAETGLRAAGTHVSLEILQEDLAGQIDYCAGIGCTNLVLASLPQERRDAGDIAELAPFFDSVGMQCRDRGMTFAYHNHDFDFARVNGHTLLDLLLETTDSTLVRLELDVYWAAYAGIGVETFLRKHAGRIPLIHLKDMLPDGGPADVGDGALDFAGILSTARNVGVTWLIVENDEPAGSSLDSARHSLKTLREM